MSFIGKKPADVIQSAQTLANGTVTPAKLSTGAPVWDASGNVGVGTASPTDKFHVSGGNYRLQGFSASTFTGFINQNLGASNSVYKGLFYDAQNENGVAVANMLCDINTDGSSAWSWSTQPAGSRTDRRQERMRIDSSGNFLVGTLTNPNSYRTNIQLGSGSRVLRVAGTQPSSWGAGSTLLIESTIDASLELYNTNLSKYLRIVHGGDGKLSFGASTFSGWSQQFDESGQAAKRDGAGSWVGTSDERLKTNFAPINASEAFARISKLNPTKYQWAVQESHSGQTGDQFGFKAQDWQQAYPNSVYEMTPSKEEQHLIPEGKKALGLAFNADFYADLVAVIKEQQAIIEQLKADVAALKASA